MVKFFMVKLTATKFIKNSVFVRNIISLTYSKVEGTLSFKSELSKYLIQEWQRLVMHF